MEKEMLFHTNLRNIGLFITLTLGCLTYRNTFKKDKLSKHILYIAIIFLYISIILNLKINKIKDNKNKDIKIIPKLILIIHLIIIFYIFNTLKY